MTRGWNLRQVYECTVNTSHLIGLTGNLGSGKSTIRKMLESLGARGVDADALAHTAMQRGTPGWRAVVDTFGADILTFNGRIDRQKLGERVFANADGLAKLEAITHPAVGALIKQIVRDAPEPVIVIEAIKLIEAGLHFWCDAIWVVKCAPEVQVERVMRDRKMSEADARARLAAQSPLEDKLRFAHVVIDNSGNTDATRAAVEQAWRAIHPETARDKREWLFDLAPRNAAPPAEPAAPVVTPQITHVAPPPAPAPAETPPTTHVAPPSAPAPVAAEEETSPPVPVWAKSTLFVQASPTVMPAWASTDLNVEVRRARRSDLEALSVAIAKL